MLPGPSPLLARAPANAKHVTTVHNPTGTLASIGVAVGDLVIFGATAGNSANNPNDYTGPTSGSGGAWTFLIGGGQGGSIWYRVVNAADVAAAIGNVKNASGSGGDFYLTAYRGARTLVGRGGGNGATAPVTAAGFTRSARHAGILIVTGDVQNYPSTATAPATFTNRFAQTSQANVLLYDRLNPANPLYVNGTAFTIAKGASGASGNLNYAILELQR